MSSLKSTSRFWHSRHGHVNYQAMMLISEKNMVRGIPQLVQPKEVCVGCLMSKLIKKIFPSTRKLPCKTEIKLIQGDLCGPITPEIKVGNKYFLLLVNDYSRAMWVYMLTSKDEALGFSRKLGFWSNENQRKISNYCEQIEGESFARNNSLIIVIIQAYRGNSLHLTPHSKNGVVERKTRTIVAMTGSLLKEKKLSSQLRGKAIRHSVYLLNRLPTVH